MDFQTACREVIVQTLPEHETSRTFLGRLRQGQPPVPGQVTSLLLALKVIRVQLKAAPVLEKELAYALFLAAYESRNLFESGYAAQVPWPPLLDEDLTRIAIAVHSIFSDNPQPLPATDA